MEALVEELNNLTGFVMDGHNAMKESLRTRLAEAADAKEQLKIQKRLDEWEKMDIKLNKDIEKLRKKISKL